jgi:hypothetical protein
MNGEYAVLGILRDTTAVSDIVGTRVYLNGAPQTDPYPLIIIEAEGIEPKHTKDGPSVSEPDMIRVYPYSANAAELKSLAQACRDALDGKAAGTYNTVAVVDITFMDQTDFDEQIENRKVYAKDQEYRVWVNL